MVDCNWFAAGEVGGAQLRKAGTNDGCGKRQQPVDAVFFLLLPVIDTHHVQSKMHVSITSALPRPSPARWVTLISDSHYSVFSWTQNVSRGALSDKYTDMTKAAGTCRDVHQDGSRPTANSHSDCC